MSSAVTYELAYAIGDVHGRFDLMIEALGAIARHAGARPHRTIFLGDYVDRGPDSRRVVERLMAIQGPEVVCLKGNHEELMVQALTDSNRSHMRRWLEYGGRQTLESYGVGADEDPLEAVPREHLRWMNGLQLTTADDHRIFVHAGLSPDTAFHEQKEATCLWIREQFLRAPAGAFEAHVVHGHTPVWEGKPEGATPELLAHRTNLDTGAFASGVLSIGVFDAAVAGGPVEVISICGEPGHASGSMSRAQGRVAEKTKSRSLWGGLAPWRR